MTGFNPTPPQLRSKLWFQVIFGEKKKVIKFHRKCFTAAQNLREVNTSRCTQEKSHLPDFAPNVALKLMRCNLLSHVVAFDNFT